MATESINLGWKALGKWLNKLAKTVDGQTPIAGQGITCEPSESGTVISWIPPNTSTQDGASTPGRGNVNVSLAGGGGSSTAPNLDDLTARVAALEAILAGSTWGSVDTMDSSCNRSTIHILTRS